ncbi:MAG TPA: UvrD-helicase domain-containing protein [Gammaproteobacteria bacterium]|nr:UvrD-helicase domain-containing protein [Gammaproteobacteria bacterium]
MSSDVRGCTNVAGGRMPGVTSIHAASAPERHATVTASAGTGKTWLLVTRLIRLLLAGARPDAILAITFTRKAAAEMQTRLNDRLFELARCSDAELRTALQGMGVAPDEENCAHARGLYEALLRSEQPLKISTFHAFCQELLQRFPLEADVSPGFELTEQTAHWQRTAWHALLREATETPDGVLAEAMLTLFDLCGGLHGAETALTSFLEHRSDWWAYSESQPDPVSFAINNLAKQLGIDPDSDAVSEFFSAVAPGILPPATLVQQLHEYAELLMKFSGNPHHIRLLQDCLNGTEHNELHIRMIREVFLIQDGTPRKRPITKAQATLLGDAAAQRFVFIFEHVCERLAWFTKHTTLNASRAWFTAGSRYLDLYQRLKAEQGLLDFSDLEWQAYRLLNRSDHALWVQYKLDQRIDHLLIDEFQDTNPTQWHLILPLLEELAAGPTRERSVFLVGDHKQSIYRFRRADPHLFTAAQSWLEKNLQSESFPLHASWRSATAIIECVNRLFSLPALAEQFGEFETHITHRDDLWGRVELLPLITVSETAPDTTARDALRNPLVEPRVLEEDVRHHEEGRLIAQRIQALINTRTLIGPPGSARPVNYGDILILLRNRTHAQSYETALREIGIPYLGAARGTLLESLEVQDMLALLDTLITPYDNLALAQVLRSPLFTCSDADLMQLSATPPDEMPWNERLKLLAPELVAPGILPPATLVLPCTSDPGTPLYRAHHSLNHWRALAGRLPVHDLLDRIYCEGNVMARFEAAFPDHLAARVRGNLTRFIELALELDSGRYPSLPQFRAQLRAMAQTDREAPDDATAPGITACVRIMTIHAAKGLEAPVVFLADAGRAPTPTRPYQVLIEWPSAAPRPTHFLLSGKKEDLDTLSMTLLERHKSAERREDANLFYVALTRAQQILFISGCAPNKGSDLGWYDLIQQALSPPGEVAPSILPHATLVRPCTSHDAQVIESGESATEVTASQHDVSREPVEVDAGLSQPILLPNRVIEIAPSRTGSPQPTLYDEDGRLRGIVIHRMLEKLTELFPIKDSELLKRIAHEHGLETGDNTLQGWWSEACGIIRQPQFRDIYDPTCYLTAYNEVPISYQAGTTMVHGVIDRLVVHTDRITVVDYKTHEIVTPDNLTELAEPYRAQLHHYGVAASSLWPEKPVRTLLLFTACSRLYEI